jgi:hypothetical protein
MTSEFTSDFFTSSSRAWRANKKRVGEGSFVYKCGVEKCKNLVRGDAANCRYHLGQGIVLKINSKAVDHYCFQPRGVGSSEEDVVGANPPAVRRVDVNRLAQAPPAPEQTTTQGTGSRADPAPPAHTDGSPTAPPDQGVAHRVAHRRRGCPSR